MGEPRHSSAVNDEITRDSPLLSPIVGYEHLGGDNYEARSVSYYQGESNESNSDFTNASNENIIRLSARIDPEAFQLVFCTPHSPLQETPPPEQRRALPIRRCQTASYRRRRLDAATPYGRRKVNNTLSNPSELSGITPLAANLVREPAVNSLNRITSATTANSSDNSGEASFDRTVDATCDTTISSLSLPRTPETSATSGETETRPPTVIPNPAMALAIPNELRELLNRFEDIKLMWEDDYDGLDLERVPIESLTALADQSRGIQADIRSISNDLRKIDNLPDVTSFCDEMAEYRSKARDFVRQAWTRVTERNSVPDPPAAAPAVLLPNASRPASAASATSSVCTEILAERVEERYEALCDEAIRVKDDLEAYIDQHPVTSHAMRELEAKLQASKLEAEDLVKQLDTLGRDAVKAELRGRSRLIHDTSDQLRDMARRAAASVADARQTMGLPAAGSDRNNRPPMKAPVFSGRLGDPLDYYSFIQQFSDYTEHCNIFSKPEKLVRMKTECVVGEALDLIRDIDTYDQAMSQLKLIYAKPEVLFAFKVKELSDLGKCPDNIVEKNTWCRAVQTKLTALNKLVTTHKLEDSYDVSDVVTVIQAGMKEKDLEIFNQKLMDMKDAEPNLRITRKLLATQMTLFVAWLVKKTSLELDTALAMKYRNATELFKGLKIDAHSDKSKGNSKKSYHANVGGESTASGSGTSAAHATSSAQQTAAGSSDRSENGAQGVLTNRSGTVEKRHCKVCTNSHFLMSYCSKFQTARTKDRWGIICKARACYRCLRIDANFDYKNRTNWFREHEPYCSDEWICPEQKCKDLPPIRQNHFLICSRHIVAGEERQEAYIKSLDAAELGEKVTFYFTSVPMIACNNSFGIPESKQNLDFELVEPDVDDPPIYVLQYIESPSNDRLLTFFDSGCYSAGFSNRAFSLLETELVREGPTKLDLASDHSVEIPYGDYRFYLPLEERKGQQHKLGTITALRMEEVSSTFPLWPLQQAWEDLNEEYRVGYPDHPPLPPVEKEIGGAPVDLMIGSRYLKYFPRLVFSLPSGLSIYRAVFKAAGGRSGVLGGPHHAWREALKNSNLISARSYLSQEMRAFTAQNTTLYHLMSQPEPCGAAVNPLTGKFEPFIEDVDHEINALCTCEVVHDDETKMMGMFVHLPKQVKDFKMFDEVGSDIEYRCPRCRACGSCKRGEEIERVSLMEENEQSLIESCIRLDVEKKVVIAQLPFTADPEEKLRPNRRTAEKVLASQMKAISKNPEMKADVIKSHEKLAAKGHVVPVSSLSVDLQKEVMTGGYFIPWRTVYNTSSLSTPCRMVFDASSRTPGGESLNDILAKGQNKLAGLYGLLLRFRAGCAAFSADISMAYNAIKLEEKDYKYQKYLWIPDLEDDKQSIVMVVRTLIYGVKAAGNLTMAGFDLVAEAAIGIDYTLTLGAMALKNSAYMDDLLRAYLTFCDRDNATSTLESTLDYGSMTVKAITKSGERPDEKVSADGRTVGIVGYVWFVEEDELALDIKPLALGKSKRGKPPPPVTGDIRAALAKMFTRRILAGQVAGVFDPLGLAAPVTGRLKIDLNAVCREAGGWDTPLPEKMLDVWTENLADIQDLAALRVPRNAVGALKPGEKAQLVVCCDASEIIAVAAVYIRIPLAEGGFDCNLVTAKTKLVSKTTVPRAELRAACLGASLGHTVMRSYEDMIGCVRYVTDSAIALCWINQDQRPLMCGVRNAVIEIRRLTQLDQWFHVESDSNPADIATRPLKSKELVECQDWFKGRPWMSLADEQLPLRTVGEVVLSGQEKSEVTREIRSQEHRGILLTNWAHKMSERYLEFGFVVDPCSRPWPKVVRLVAVVMRCVQIWRKKAAKFAAKVGADGKMAAKILLSSDESAAAERQIFITTSVEAREKLDSKVLAAISEDDGEILRYKGRILDGSLPTAVEKNMIDIHPLKFNCPIVDQHSPVAVSIMTHAHVDLAHHGGVVSTLRRSQEIAFIVGGRRLAAEIKANCSHCKRFQAKLLQAEMGPLHQSRMIVAPPFYSSQIDLFGPFMAQCEHNHRAKVKVWGAAFKCTTTGAVAVECMAGYSTEHFLHAFTRFATRYGYPGRIHIDEGSQLKKACAEAKMSVGDLEQGLNQKFGVQVECVLSPVGHHETSGMVERCIKEIKRIFDNVFRGLKLDILGYQTAFYYIANELNNTPLCLGSRYKNLESLDLITPSRLIHGRNNSRAPVGICTLQSTPTRLLQQMENVDKAWWTAWEAQMLAGFIPRSRKWRAGAPDVRVGDVVIFLRDGREALIGATPWRTGRVAEVEMSDDGVIRTVVLEYYSGTAGDGGSLTKRRTRRSVRSVAVLEREQDLDFGGRVAQAEKSATIHMILKSQ